MNYNLPIKKYKAKVIAFYLPQYHPTESNNKWWGKGFTEWTNVGKAKSLFKGHEQPKVPADLGYYDLRLSSVREEQAQLAKEAGVHGFCYYHYWFGNGHQELEMPFNEVVRTKKPNFPFCLCWANESWHKKFWNEDGTCQKETLAEQIYEDTEGHIKHFYHLLEAFKDERYIRINNKLLFMIYMPLDFVQVRDFMHLWNKLAQENGLNGFHFIGQATFRKDIDKILDLGFDGVNYVGMLESEKNYRLLRFIKIVFGSYREVVVRHIKNIVKKILRKPFIRQYKDYIKSLSSDQLREYNEGNIYPTLIPNWDHTPRSGMGGYVLVNSTPELFFEHACNVFENIKNKKNDDQIVFLKAWNEWGEGNYMEPDLRYGKGYIQALEKALR